MNGMLILLLAVCFLPGHAISTASNSSTGSGDPLEISSSGVPADDWVDLSRETERVRVSVLEMEERMPAIMKADIEEYGRKRVVSKLFVTFAKAVLEDEANLLANLTDDTIHVVGAGSTQIYKTFLPAAAAVAGNVLRCPVGIVTKLCDNQRDLADKLRTSYLPTASRFKVEALRASASAEEKILEAWSTTAFVMANTEGQMKKFLGAMAALQSDQAIDPVKGWILVYDESDALTTSRNAKHKYERAMDAVAGKTEYSYLSAERLATLRLHRPSVTLHETATPLPTILRLRRQNCNVYPGNFFKLDAFPNYVSKRDYRPLKADEDDVWLDDGDLCLGNLYAKHPKTQAWVEDLAATTNGIGVYLANSRVRADRNNLDTAWALRTYAMLHRPSTPMVFAAYSAGQLRWFAPDAHRNTDWQLIRIGNRADQSTIGSAVSTLAEVAGTAPICIVAYAALRNVSWRTDRSYHNQRCQTHICNALPKGRDLSSYAQGNGRATGDSKELLARSTGGRTWITYLGHRWDHEADLSTEAFVDEVAARMSRGLNLAEATEGLARPFPPSCNFDIGRKSRQPLHKPRKTFDRPYMVEYNRTDDEDGLGYLLVLQSADPREAEFAASQSRSSTANHLPGTEKLVEMDLEDAAATPTEDIVAMASAVKYCGGDDEDPSCSCARDVGADLSSLEPYLPELAQLEKQQPVVVTTLDVFSIDIEPGQAKREMQQQSCGTIGRAVAQRYNCQGIQLCWMHSISRLNADVRTHSPLRAPKPFNVAWRAFVNSGEMMVAAIRFSSPLTTKTRPWLSETLQGQEYMRRRIAWHTFTNLPTSEKQKDGTVQLVKPTISIVTRGPIHQTSQPIPIQPAPQVSKRKRGLQLCDLLYLGAVAPGLNVLSTTYKKETYTADLLLDGAIRFRQQIFASVSAFRKKITGKQSDGWLFVEYEGRKLDAIRHEHT